MVINKSEHSIKELSLGYRDSGDAGVIAFNGLLDVRPAYQREFVYDDEKRDAVIRTIYRGRPISVMYWGLAGPRNYELIDGQQRTISICRYVNGEFAVAFNPGDEPVLFMNLPFEKQQEILEYKLDIYKCSGTEDEMLEWFETINTSGERLTRQELRNAVYTGLWLTSAKTYFSKTGCPAQTLGKDYMDGTPIRQAYLEEVLSWAADKEGFKRIEGYMSAHRRDENADELFEYYKSVISWVRSIFGPKAEKDMKGIHWGILFNRYHTTFSCLDRTAFQHEIESLRDDDEVTRKAGIYEYLLSGKTNLKALNLRKFPDKIKLKIYNQQNGSCKFCGKQFYINEMEADHIIPWSKGGHTDEGNCQLLCVQCNRSKGAKG